MPSKHLRIATVKIAPMERWCRLHIDATGRSPERQRLVGLLVQIFTNSMEATQMNHDEPCKRWQLTPEALSYIGLVLGRQVRSNPPGASRIMICEHMLEID